MFIYSLGDVKGFTEKMSKFSMNIEFIIRPIGFAQDTRTSYLLACIGSYTKKLSAAWWESEHTCRKGICMRTFICIAMFSQLKRTRKKPAIRRVFFLWLWKRPRTPDRSYYQKGTIRCLSYSKWAINLAITGHWLDIAESNRLSKRIWI